MVAVSCSWNVLQLPSVAGFCRYVCAQFVDDSDAGTGSVQVIGDVLNGMFG